VVLIPTSEVRFFPLCIFFRSACLLSSLVLLAILLSILLAYLFLCLCLLAFFTSVPSYFPTSYSSYFCVLRSTAAFVSSRSTAAFVFFVFVPYKKKKKKKK
jgi:hypothetical protein